MKIVFMGSPQFAVPILEALVTSFQVVGLITQPDRPVGRGRKTYPPPVKSIAENNSIVVYQPEKIHSQEALKWLTDLGAEIIVVAAYGQILPPEIVYSYRCVNVHASLLPRWRGAAPIPTTILAGDDVTGISLMQMDEGLDTGPVFAQRNIEILESETAGELSIRLSELGSRLLTDELPNYFVGRSVLVQQDEDAATYAPMINKAQGEMDFTQTAEYLSRQVRAFEPWPTSYFFWEGRRIVVRSAHAIPHPHPSIGQVRDVDGELGIECGSDILILESIQPEGRRAMDPASFARGAPTFLSSNLQK